MSEDPLERAEKVAAIFARAQLDVDAIGERYGDEMIKRLGDFHLEVMAAVWRYKLAGVPERWIARSLIDLAGMLEAPAQPHD